MYSKRANNPTMATKRPLYDALAAAPVNGIGLVVPETPAETWLVVPTVGLAASALVAPLTSVGSAEVGENWPTTEDTPAAEDAATGTTEAVSIDAGEEAPSAEDGIGIMGEADNVAGLETASETGQTVVYNGIVEVTTCVDLAGQLTTVDGQDVIVMRLVV